MTSPTVPFGPASFAGYLLGLGGILTDAGIAISGSKAELSGPGKWVGILSVIAIVATNLGRQLQAPLRSSGGEGASAELPSLEQELAAQPPAIPASAEASVPPPAATT